jgi:hypothetical protein
MDDLRTLLKPLTDWLPAELRDKLPVEAWWGIFAAVTFLVLVLLLLILRGIGRALFGPRRKKETPREEDVIDLDAIPLPLSQPSNKLWVYHVPARLRLIVVAPSGTQRDVDATSIERLLESVIPGLGKVAEQDRPRVRVWPPQMSHQGFEMMFARKARRRDRDGQPSRWVLLAGRANAGGQPVLIGLALWADEPNTLGRVHLEGHQWLDVLRLNAPR